MPIFLDLDSNISGSSSGAATPTADWSVHFEAGYPKNFDANLADETPFFVDLVVKDAAGLIQDARLLTIQGAVTASARILPSAGDWQNLPVIEIPGYTPVYRARILLGVGTPNPISRNRQVCIHLRATIPGASGVAVLSTKKYLITPQ